MATEATWELITISLIVLILILITWIIIQRKSIKGKSVKRQRINAIVNDIRKELRLEHKRISSLFKDLDGFLSEIPGVMSNEQEESEQFQPQQSNRPAKRLADYREE